MKTAFRLSLAMILLLNVASFAQEPVPAVTHNTWSSGAPIPTAVWGPATAVLSNSIYVVGGSTTGDGNTTTDVQVYDPVTNAWSTGVSLPTPLMGSVAAVVKNVLYVFGGSGNINCSPASSGVWAYSAKTKAWESKAAMPTAVCTANAVVVDNIIYLIGGYNGTDALTTLQSYDPATNTWTKLATLLNPTQAAAAAVIGKTIVASGGYINQQGSNTGDTEAYDVATNTWSELNPDNTARGAQCFGGIGANLYIAGGIPSNVNESFKLKKDIWKTLSTEPQIAAYPGSVAYKGKLYCISGETAWMGTMLNNVQIYQP